MEFESKEPVGSGCVAQVYRGWARADRVDDPAFQSLLEELEKEDLLEAWEIPGLGGVVGSLWQLWKGGKEKEEVHPTVLPEESSADKGHLIPVAIKVEIKVDITESCPDYLLFSARCPTADVPLCVPGDPPGCEEAGGNRPPADESRQLAPAVPAGNEVAQSLRGRRGV